MILDELKKAKDAKEDIDKKLNQAQGRVDAANEERKKLVSELKEQGISSTDELDGRIEELEEEIEEKVEEIQGLIDKADKWTSEE